MALATRCPRCGTSFRVVADQLKLRGGLVRCGSCRHVFDAIASITPIDDDAATDAIVPPPAAPVTTAAAPVRAKSAPAAPTPPAGATAPAQPAVVQRPAVPVAAEPAAAAQPTAAGEPAAVAPAAGATPPPSTAAAATPPRSGDATAAAAAPDALAARGAPAERTPRTPSRRRAGQEADRSGRPRGAERDDERGAARSPSQAAPEPERGAAAAAPVGRISSVTFEPSPVEGAAAPWASGRVPAARAAAPTEADDGGSPLTLSMDSVHTAGPALLDDEQPPEFLREPTLGQRGFSVFFAGGALVLALLCVIQLAVLVRGELIARWPPLRPVLVAICRVYGCSVSWPVRAEMLAVVGTDLQSVPGTDVLELTTVVRNRASFRMALPSIELTLTDLQGRAVARKVFAPADYLPPGANSAARIDDGLDGGADLPIKVIFEARGLTAVGFVVYPFFL